MPEGFQSSGVATFQLPSWAAILVPNVGASVTFAMAPHHHTC